MHLLHVNMIREPEHCISLAISQCILIYLCSRVCMSHFGSNMNQIKDGLPCRFQIFLSGMLGIGRNSYISSFPLGKKRGEKID